MSEKQFLLTPVGRVAYPHLFTPYTYPNSGKEAQYEVVLIFKQKDDLSGIKQAVITKLREAFGREINLEDYDLPFRRCKDKYAADGYVSDDIWIKFKTKYAPSVVDQRRAPMVESDVYAGCYGRVSCEPFSFNASGNKGVAFNFSHFQFCRGGDPLKSGGRASADDVFDDLPADAMDLPSLDDIVL
jgi:hypothetical protein